MLLVLASAVLGGLGCSGAGGSNGSKGTAGSITDASGTGGSSGVSGGGGGAIAGSGGNVGGAAGVDGGGGAIAGSGGKAGGAAGADGGAAGITQPPCNPLGGAAPGNAPACPPFGGQAGLPNAGDSCVSAGLQCSYIQSGLGCYNGGPYTITCCSGVWSTGSCPKDAGTDAASDAPATSCPASQPTSGAACVGTLHCGYGQTSCCGFPSSELTCACRNGFFDCYQTVECNVICPDAGRD
jgi:hypothetical protein